MERVLSRKLTTGSKTDVQFDGLDGTYEFGFAAFDNAQMRHAVHFNPLKLKFAKRGCDRAGAPEHQRKRDGGDATRWARVSLFSCQAAGSPRKATVPSRCRRRLKYPPS